MVAEMQMKTGKTRYFHVDHPEITSDASSLPSSSGQLP
jgi:hypothetical protein